MTLRHRLLLSVLGLIALLGITIGVVSSVALNGFLVNRLDAQLTAATSRSLDFIGGPRPGAPTSDTPPDPAGFIGIVGQSAGTMGALMRNGAVVKGAVVLSSGDTELLSGEQRELLAGLSQKSAAQTVNFGGDLGSYRVIVNTSLTGTGIIIGLPLAEVAATVTQLDIVIASVTVAGLIVAALIGTIVLRLALRPLDRVAATATRVTTLRLDRGDVALAERVPADDTDPRTEVGRVGSALNRLLDHVGSALEARHASENKVRRFVADASHELRTPLASIRGYAELTRRAGHRLPEDVTHSLARIESEATRMTSLVEDLLLLARLDSQPELASDPVDLTAVLIDAVSDAHVAAPDHHFELDLPEQPVEIRGDAQRLYQVVANLLANTRVHTPAGTTVTVGLDIGFDSDGSPSAIVTVADNGPGIAPELQSTLFERFVRGDSSRYRQAGSSSTGLGLAIVSAVAQAHGGGVRVTSRPGDTVLRVILHRDGGASARASAEADDRPVDITPRE
jgi:two-component system OmpR family sensor kinase